MKGATLVYMYIDLFNHIAYSHPPNKDLENQSDKKITLEQALPGPFDRDDTDPNHSHMK